MTDMACACDCDYDGEPAAVYRATLRTARKTHKCIECSGEISQGQEYEYVTAFWEGEWDTVKTCLGCARLRDDMCRCPHGALRSEIEAQFGFDYVTNEEI
jgi:hypothetical protein